ncbi:MAG TPA: hypothetical protein VK158_00760 [Acidobacteriota bacterium]|nr:hypothetical protein [Acidobacteriota bacterium]
MFTERRTQPSKYLLYAALIAAGYCAAYVQFVTLSPFSVSREEKPTISYKGGPARELIVSGNGNVLSGTLHERVLDLLLEHPKNLERTIEDITQKEPLVYRK